MLLEADKAFGSGLPTIGDVVRTFGGYWTDAHQTNNELARIGVSFRNAARDSLRSITAFQNNLDYRRATSLRHVTYYPLHVDIDLITKTAIKYGDGYSYGGLVDETTLSYGDHHGDVWEFPIPKDLVSFAAILDKAAAPNLFLTFGTMANINDVAGTIEIRCPDLFDKFSASPEAPPNHITVWLYMASFDDNTVAKQYAGDIPLDLIKHTNVEAVKAIREADVDGPSELTLRKFISGCTGSPIAKENETVVTILQQDNIEIVLTDKNRYVGLPDDDAVVEVDDKLVIGDFMFESVMFTDFNGGNVPTWLNYVEFPRTYFGTRNSVYIQNLSLDVVYPQLDSHRVSVRFPIIVDPSDKDLFWESFSAAANNTHPTLVSKIAGTAGLPIADTWFGNTSSLPTEINVLSYIAKSWLQYGVSLCQIRFSMVSERNRRLLRHLSGVVPPWVSHIVQYVNEDGSIAVGRCRDISMAHTSVNTLSSGLSSLYYGEIIDNEGSCCAVDSSCMYLQPNGIFAYELPVGGNYLRPEDECTTVYSNSHILRADGTRKVLRGDGVSFILRSPDNWS